MSDPHSPGDMKVTIKYGKGYEESWAVFGGTPQAVRENICAYFNIECASVADLSLHELVVQVTKVAHGTSLIANQLGGTPIPDKGAQAPAQETAQAATSAPSAAPEPEADPNPLLARIEAQESVQTLQRLWAENQQAFAADADLMAAYKAKGRALQGADKA